MPDSLYPVKVSIRELEEFIILHRRAKALLITHNNEPDCLPDTLRDAAGSLNAFVGGVADLSGQDLRNQPLADVNLSGADLSATLMSGMVLWNTNFDHACLERSRLDGVELTWASLRHARMNAVVLRNAMLDHTCMQGAKLTNARLNYAQLRYADLTGANLAASHLQHAVLDHTILRDAILRDALLEDTKLYQAELEGAVVTNTLLDPATQAIAPPRGNERDSLRMMRHLLDGLHKTHYDS